MLGNGHVRFGRRTAETDQSKDRHRAAARPHTEHHTAEGKLYLCAIKDCFSNKIVGYSIDSRMKARLAVAAVNNAVARRAATGADVAGCIVHADRGSQGGFNWSLQHLDRGGVHGQTSGMDDGVDG